MAKIFIFRHGETPDNRDKVFSGWREPDLTEGGIKEAEKIAEELKNEKVTKAYSSGQLRSMRTLEIVLKKHENIPIKVDQRIKDRNYGDLTRKNDQIPIPILMDSRIKERDYGDLTGKSKDELEKKFPHEYPLWYRSYNTAPPGGESIKDVEVRVLSFLNDLIPTLKKDDVVFISAHGNSLRPMRRYFENITIEEMVSFEHTPGKIYSYEI